MWGEQNNFALQNGLQNETDASWNSDYKLGGKLDLTIFEKLFKDYFRKWKRKFNYEKM